jgi:3-deoxy-D-manno-octulosonate 8-phosphate phosphatase KdsC-like HAD superfamily phosphatase
MVTSSKEQVKEQCARSDTATSRAMLLGIQEQIPGTSAHRIAIAALCTSHVAAAKFATVGHDATIPT